MDLRPLDPVRSIKAKLGILVVAAVTGSLLLTWFALLELGFWPRYTLPLALALAVLVTQLLARGMTAPLREMTGAARAMARGEYGRRVQATSRDEVGELAAAFNRMAEDLERVDGQRRELVANVSHELRTPVAALSAVLENLVDGVTPADPQTLGNALEQTRRLGRLVDDLLDLSRVDGGAAPLRRTAVPLRPLLDGAVAVSRAAWPGTTFVLRVDPPDLAADADPARLRQVVGNLLDNAARHGPRGRVQVGATRRNGVLVLDVVDEGPGIPAGEREQVFERFTRGSSGSAGGTGLGLAIARYAVELHGGWIEVVDDAPGEPAGCRIRVTIPDEERT